MASTVSRKPLTLSAVSEEGTLNYNTVVVVVDVEEEKEAAETSNTVTGQLYLKPAHTTETFNKDQVLRRIRHRKRMNKLRNALQSLLSSPFSSSSAEPNKDPVHRSWLDDAFAAP